MGFLPPSLSELLLASTSPARIKLLTQLGIPFRAISPGVDERVDPTLSVRQTVEQLAERKARAVLSRFPAALVIGSDQLVSFEGKALGKPADRQAARDQLLALSGTKHHILTAVCLASAQEIQCGVDIATLTVHAHCADEIEAYLDTDEWRGCAGAYRIEGRGQALFSAIDGDRTSIQGLPMALLLVQLRQAGVRVLLAPAIARAPTPF
jgi:septum formation protein